MAATLPEELRGLFGRISDTRVPASAELHEYFQARGLPIKPAGQNLNEALRKRARVSPGRRSQSRALLATPGYARRAWE